MILTFNYTAKKLLIPLYVCAVLFAFAKYFFVIFLLIWLNAKRSAHVWNTFPQQANEVKITTLKALSQKLISIYNLHVVQILDHFIIYFTNSITCETKKHQMIPQEIILSVFYDMHLKSNEMLKLSLITKYLPKNMNFISNFCSILTKNSFEKRLLTMN